jgi:hypothetical protein
VTSFDARPIEAAAMAGWQLHKSSGSSDFATFIADNGHAASSSVRSFGDFDMPDRALGSIANQLENLRQLMIERTGHEIQSGRDRFRYPAGN